MLKMLALADSKDRKIAWSEVSTIAYINDDDISVSIQVYIQAEDGSFKLSPPTSLDLAFHQSERITHLEFSHQGLELAVVDRSGRVSVHNAGQDGINKLVMTASHDEQLGSLRDASVLALKWQAGLCPVRQARSLFSQSSPRTFTLLRASVEFLRRSIHVTLLTAFPDISSSGTPNRSRLDHHYFTAQNTIWASESTSCQHYKCTLFLHPLWYP
jgi:hypothetical protein